MPNVVSSHQNPPIFACFFIIFPLVFERIPKPMFFPVLAAQDHQKPPVLNLAGLFGRPFGFPGVPKVVAFHPVVHFLG